MTIKIKAIISRGLLGCGVAAALTACSDTWDEHYDSLGSGVVHDGTLWQAIKSNPDLSNFAKVVEACDFAKSLDGSQVFTVFAPTNANFSSAEADELISDYRQQEQAGVTEDDNTVIKEFVQNHVALYNYSVNSTSNDSIMLMNGKYAVLGDHTVDGVEMLSKNQLYGNGVLYTLNNKVDFMSNVFEYIRKDPELDSLRSFFYNSKFYYKDFVPERSVPGSIVDGKTQYLDSVFTQRNELFSLLSSQLNTEDSTYIMVAPTNDVWKQLIDEYESYFNYPEDIEKRDSMVYTNSRLAIVRGTTFSRTFNTDESLRDSAMSENCIRQYSYRRSMWGAPFEYYEYRRPLDANGALSQPAEDIVACSNGQLHKARTWNIDKLMGFHQYIIVEAESRNSIKEIKKQADNHGDSIATATATMCSVPSDNRFFGRVWNNAYVEFKDVTTSPAVTFNLSNVLSNIGYDIYLVNAPALANDSNATEAQRIPTVIQCTLKEPGKKEVVLTDPVKGGKTFTTKRDSMDYMLLAENYKFGVCTYGVEDEKQQVTLTLEPKVSSSNYRTGKYSRTMRIDCILLVPHGTFYVLDELPATTSYPGQPGVAMFPHGIYEDRSYKWWYMLR